MTLQATRSKRSVAILGLLVACAFVYALVSPAPPPPAVLSKPDFEFSYRGNAVADMQFSPDGGKIALVTFETKIRDRYGARFAARIYNVPQGTLDHELPSGAWKSAWTMDGSILALAKRNDAKEIDLWDTRGWRIRQTLPLGYPKSLDTQPYVVRLCFDRRNNLYIAEFEYGFEGYGFGTRFDEYSPRVWWNLGDHWNPQPALFGSCPRELSEPDSHSIAPYDLAVSTGLETRIAFTAWNCWAQVFKVQESANGQRSIERQFSLREAHWIKLAPDGEHLVVFGRTSKEQTEVRVFHLGARRAQLIGTGKVAAPPPTDDYAPQMLDVSRDGNLAAICTCRGFEVLRVPSCQPVAKIPKKLDVNTAVCFSPDCQFLAVDDKEHHTVRFYRVPQEAQ
jgi:hypothetical protein